MAQIEENNSTNSKKYLKRKLMRVDLTPMVDLGFLLMTFFILTTIFSQPTVAKLLMPKDSPENTHVKKNAVLTISLLRNDSIAWYEGIPDKSQSQNYCRLNNLRSIIQQKQKKVAAILGNRSETILIVYPEKESTYKNLVDVLDEVVINDISHYFIMNSK
jgi:biopolymer transport protein ExbD